MIQIKRILRGLLMAGALTLVSSTVFAQNSQGNDNDQGSRPKLPNNSSRGVPEIDPVALGAVGAVLVGGTLLIGARRRRRAPHA
jgi:LPXTG-motif cell wall-anchored protein